MVQPLRLVVAWWLTTAAFADSRLDQQSLLHSIDAVLPVAIAKLLEAYNPASGTFSLPLRPGFIPYWTTAYSIETLSSAFPLLTAPLCEDVLGVFANTFSKTRYVNVFRDDALWWVHAWARVSAATGNSTYLDISKSVFADLVGPWQGWNTSCGGMQWNATGGYRNAITNELLLSAATLLADSVAASEAALYQAWAAREWNWFNASTMLQRNAVPGVGALVQDGLDGGACANPGPVGGYWTYNSGVLLSGLARLASAPGGDSSLSSLCVSLIRGAAAHFSANGDGIFREVGCRADGWCDGSDGRLFKGAFVRHLGYAAPTLLASASPEDAGFIVSWLATNAASLLAHDVVWSAPSTGGAARPMFGQLWQGPPTPDDTPWLAQSVAIDLLVAARVALASGSAVQRK